MADPRYRGGVFMGNGYKHRSGPEISDSPLFHGWKPVKRLESGGRVWQLESNPDVKMRRRLPTEDPRNGEWRVQIGKDIYGYDGTLGQITQDVKNSTGVEDKLW